MVYQPPSALSFCPQAFDSLIFSPILPEKENDTAVEIRAAMTHGPNVSWTLGLPISSSTSLESASSPGFSSTALNHYPTLQALTSQFQQMTLLPLLGKLMLLDMRGVLIKVLCYKRQNPVSWLNATFVKSYFVVQRLCRRTREPS